MLPGNLPSHIHDEAMQGDFQCGEILTPMDLHLLIQHRTKAINLKKNAELKI
jgi:hypothetical protein